MCCDGDPWSASAACGSQGNAAAGNHLVRKRTAPSRLVQAEPSAILNHLMEVSSVTVFHRTPPTPHRGDGDVRYQGRRVATVTYILGLFPQANVAASADGGATPGEDPLHVKGGTVQLIWGSIPTDGEQLVLGLSDGRRLHFVATHKVDRVYRVTPVG